MSAEKGEDFIIHLFLIGLHFLIVNSAFPFGAGSSIFHSALRIH